MSKPRVAILHYSAPPVIGGVESAVAAHASLLAERRYTVKVVAGRGEPFDPRVPLEIIPLLNSQHPFVLEVSRALTLGNVTPEMHALVAAISHKLTEALTEVDVCIAHNALTLHKNLALTGALHAITQTEPRLRLIGWCHDFVWDDPVYAGELHEGYPWNLLCHAWAGVQYVVVSEARRATLANRFGLDAAKIAIVPPGVEAHEFFRMGETATRWTRQLNLLSAEPLLLLPARVTRRKNIELAIDITAALRALGWSPKLLVMGPPGAHNPSNRIYLNELLSLRRALRVEDAVIFLHEFGAVDDETRRDLYWLADALLFPSEREGFGVPILEAGLARLPIFCSDIAPFRESAGDWAHYFALDEPPRAIATRIAETLKHDARYQLKRRVAEQYGWFHIFQRHIEPLLRGGTPHG